MLWGEAACLGAGADADTDANADDDWGQDPEEEDGHDTGSGGSRSGGKFSIVVNVQVLDFIQGGF